MAEKPLLTVNLNAKTACLQYASGKSELARLEAGPDGFAVVTFAMAGQMVTEVPNLMLQPPKPKPKQKGQAKAKGKGEANAKKANKKIPAGGVAYTSEDDGGGESGEEDEDDGGDAELDDASAPAALPAPVPDTHMGDAPAPAVVAAPVAAESAPAAEAAEVAAAVAPAPGGGKSYGKYWYGKGNRVGIWRKDGKKCVQFFSYNARNSGKDKEQLETIADECLTKLRDGTLSEDAAKKFCTDKVDA